MYSGNGNKGAAILASAIIIGNLNVLILPLISLANPTLPPVDSRAIWAYWIPRVVHDVVVFWSVAFWLWAIIDAYFCAKKSGVKQT